MHFKRGETPLSYDFYRRVVRVRSMGRYFYDVRTEGGGGFENALILRTDSTDKLREMKGRGGGGQNTRKFCGRH